MMERQHKNTQKHARKSSNQSTCLSDNNGNRSSFDSLSGDESESDSDANGVLHFHSAVGWFEKILKILFSQVLFETQSQKREPCTTKKTHENGTFQKLGLQNIL
jgi:hypothetical protein